MKTNHSKAFTLIELLTVIAIIGILAAILIPVVGRVRDGARQAKCVSNIREAARGIVMLAEMEEFRLVTHGEGNSNELWPNQLMDANLLESPEVLYCPSQDTGLVLEGFVDAAWNWRTYGFNMFDKTYGQMMQTFGQPGRRWGINFNKVEDPSSYILLADSIDSRDLPRFRIDSASAGGDGSIHLRHNSRAVVAFLDGHAEACDPERLGILGMISGHGETYADVITFPKPSL